MPTLVAVPLGGPAFVAVLRRLWDEGAAVFPLDPRLPPPVRAAVLARVRPTEVWDEEGRRGRPGGEPAADGDALVLATSGTTATPKGVVLTHAALEHAARMTSDALAVDHGADTWLCCAPVAHAGGFGVVNRAVRTDTPLLVHTGFDAAAVTASGASLTALVPTMLTRIDPARFRRILLGGMGVPADRPANVVATYGLTETMGGVVYDRRPLPGVELRIGPGGVVEVRTPTALRGYRTEGGEHDPKDADGWLATSDLGVLDADGLLTVHGRADDVILTGGEKVWPEAVEAVLRRLPDVGDVAVIGRPDAEWGQVVVAVVEVAPNQPPPALEELRSAVKESLPPWCAPRAVELVEALPRTPSGKVRRDGLRRAAQA